MHESCHWASKGKKVNQVALKGALSGALDIELVQEYFTNVSRVFQKCFKDFSNVFKRVSRMFHGCFKIVLKVFQGRFNNI